MGPVCHKKRGQQDLSPVRNVASAPVPQEQRDSFNIERLPIMKLPVYEMLYVRVLYIMYCV